MGYKEMNMSKPKQSSDSFDPKATSIFGVFLAFSGYLFFGGIYLLVSIFNFKLEGFIGALKVIAVYSVFLWLLGPLFGTLLALVDKSWNIFKTWLLASIVAMLINLTISIIFILIN